MKMQTRTRAVRIWKVLCKTRDVGGEMSPGLLPESIGHISGKHKNCRHKKPLIFLFAIAIYCYSFLSVVNLVNNL